MHNTLRDAILSRTADFKAEFDADPQDINAGLCADFADSLFDDLRDQMPLKIINTDDLFEHILGQSPIAYLDTISLPEELKADDLNQTTADIMSHSWIVLNGRHYDAETPEGVEDPFCLPFFQRAFPEYLNREAAPRPS